MKDYTYLQNKFLEHYVDRSKQRYLSQKQDFNSVVIGFYGHMAAVIPFMPKDSADKEKLAYVTAMALAVKDVKRLGFFFDGWAAKSSPVNTRGLSEEESLARAQEERRKLPADFNAGDFEGRFEQISWGFIGEKGPEKYMVQAHDSKTHSLLSKAMTEPDVKGRLYIFEKIMARSKDADFNKIGVSKSKLWHMLEVYLNNRGTPVFEFDIRK